LVARTAASIVACPLIMITCVSLPAARSRPSNSSRHRREGHIEQQDVVAALGEALLGHLDAPGYVDCVALERQRLFEGVQNRRLVVDDERCALGIGLHQTILATIVI
jgi:hypothetical protein